MKKIVQSLLLLLLFMCGAASFAEEIEFSFIVPEPAGGCPKTGQTISYPAGDATDRDDGHYQRGTPALGAHYQDNSDGTITDNATGLEWVQDPSLCGGSAYPTIWATAPNVPIAMTWNTAIAYCEALDYAGHSDWRLPNIKELMSIVDYSTLSTGTGVDPIFICNNFYWSSTTIAYWSTEAWVLRFYDGGYSFRGPKNTPCFVRPVRGGRD